MRKGCAEGYSYDATSQLGYLAAKTSTIELGTGVVPIDTRTPTLLAMSAAGVDYLSDGRFRLGIGTSGPQLSGRLPRGAVRRPLAAPAK